MNLLGRTEKKMYKFKNGENVLHSEAAEVVLVHCNAVNNNYHQNLRVIAYICS